MSQMLRFKKYTKYITDGIFKVKRALKKENISHIKNTIISHFLNFKAKFYKTSLGRRFAILPYAWKIVVSIIGVVVLWMSTGIFTHSDGLSDKEILEKQINEERNLNKDFFKLYSSNPQEYHTYLNVSGVISIKHKVNLVPEVSGKVIDVPVSSGDFVKKDTPIVQIEVEDKKEVLEQDLATLKQQELNYNSILNLYKKGLSSKYELSGAISNLNAAKAAVTMSERNLYNTSIRAPFDGYVDYIVVNKGDVLGSIFSLNNSDQVVATMINLADIRVQANIAPKYLSQIRENAEIKIVVPKFLEKQKNNNKIIKNKINNGNKIPEVYELKGNIVFVSNIASTNNNTFLVEAKIKKLEENTSNDEQGTDNCIIKSSKMLNAVRFADGENIELLISIGKKIAHKLPQSTLVLSDEGILGIKTLNSQEIVEFYPVEITGEDSDGVWLTGLPEVPLNVIVMGQAYAKEGSRLEL